MLIASCGASIEPIKEIINYLEPKEICLFTYGRTHVELLRHEVSNLIPNIKIFIEPIEIPPEPSDEWWNELIPKIQSTIKNKNPQLDADIYLNGGTPWLSHTLHHVANLLGMNVTIATIKKIEGPETLFFELPNPLKTHQIASELIKLTGPRYEILDLLKNHGALTMQELSNELETKNESIRFLLEGRKNRSKNGSRFAFAGMKTLQLVEHTDDVMTGKKGRPTYRYKLTTNGFQVLSNMKFILHDDETSKV